MLLIIKQDLMHIARCLFVQQVLVDLILKVAVVDHIEVLHFLEPCVYMYIEFC